MWKEMLGKEHGTYTIIICRIVMGSKVLGIYIGFQELIGFRDFNDFQQGNYMICMGNVKENGEENMGKEEWENG